MKERTQLGTHNKVTYASIAKMGAEGMMQIAVTAIQNAWVAAVIHKKQMCLYLSLFR